LSGSARAGGGGPSSDTGLHACVMAGGEDVEAETPGARQEGVELDVPVALDARVRRAALGMGEDVRGDDRAIEVLGHVEHVVRDAELLGDAARVVDVGHRTAPRVRRATQSFNVAPTTSWPAPTIRAAATDESTPPDMPRGLASPKSGIAGVTHGHAAPLSRATAGATAARACATSASSLAQPREKRTPCERHARRRPWRATHGSPPAHRSRTPSPPRRTRRRRRAARAAPPARSRGNGRGSGPEGRRAQRCGDGVGHGAEEPVAQRVTQARDTRALARPAGARGGHRRGHADGAGHALGPAAALLLLPPPKASGTRGRHAPRGTRALRPPSLWALTVTRS